MSNRLLQLLPALLLAVLALVLALVGLSRTGSHESAQAHKSAQAVMASKTKTKHADYSYWVAKHDENAGASLNAKDLAKITAGTQLENAIPTTQKIDGKTLRRPLRAGEIVTPSHLKASSLLAHAIPPGYRALAMNVSAVKAAGGLLRPGDLVDVLVSFSRGTGKQHEPVVLTLLRNIEVLALHGRLLNHPPKKKDHNRNGTALLLVPKADVNRLYLAMKTGAIKLASVGSHKTIDSSAKASSTAVEQGKPASPAVTPHKRKETAGQLAAQASQSTQEVKRSDLFPSKPVKKVKRHVRRAPSGHKVKVYEGSNARSTYVH